MGAVFRKEKIGSANDFSLKGELKYDVNLSEHNSWRVGGKADRFYLPADKEDLIQFLRQLPEKEPLFWLGLGSNLLVRDGGFRGTVVCTKNRLKGMKVLSEGLIYVEAGVPCALVAKFCADQGFIGAEFLAGIPGTMGGALAMNAGAFGGETWSLVSGVETISQHGAVFKRSVDDYEIGYRSVQGPEGEWFLACTLSLSKGDGAEIRTNIKKLLAKRYETQPTNQPSCGSVFRNPEGDFSARLIEASGLKGFSIGGAQVSPKHANFIVNTGLATSDDIERVIRHVKFEVNQKFGVDLIPEFRVIGVQKGAEE